MSIARATARILRQQLRAHVAWLPLTNNFELGDFGVFSGGVFTRIGNIRGLGVDFDTTRNDGSPFEFRSEGTREFRLSAGVVVDRYLEDDPSASLRITFSSADSLYIRSANLQTSEIAQLLPVAATLRNHPQWRMRYRVVHRVWTAVEGVFISSRSASASIDLHGTVHALTSLQSGKLSVDAGLQVGARTDVGLDLIGHTGPLGLGLFRVRVLDGAPAFINFDVNPDPDVVEVLHADDDPEDDI